MTALALRQGRSTAEELEKQVMRERVFPAAPAGPSQRMMTLSPLGTDTCAWEWVWRGAHGDAVK